MQTAMHAPVLPDPIDSELLMLAYRNGIFPMADSRTDTEIFWVEPKRRAVLPLGGFHCSRSLGRRLRRGRFTVTCNGAFEQVLSSCAQPRASEDGESWISERIAASYLALHRLGQAHSIECWHDGALAGGLYGVGFDRVFCGESMFSRQPDASKVALAWLVAALRRGRAELLDCQFMTPHLASLGAQEITQKRYVELLVTAQRPYSPPAAGFGDGSAGGFGPASGEGLGAESGEGLGVLPLPGAFAALLADAADWGVSSSPGNFIAHCLTQTS
jgi:leucyl/phenylalanyl-tRNA--protein transferase